MLTDEEIEERFGFHDPTHAVEAQLEKVAGYFKEIARELNIAIPEGRAKAIMFTKLEEAQQWANYPLLRIH